MIALKTISLPQLLNLGEIIINLTRSKQPHHQENVTSATIYKHEFICNFQYKTIVTQSLIDEQHQKFILTACNF